MRVIGIILIAITFVCGCEPASDKGRQVILGSSTEPVMQVGLVLDSPSQDTVQMAFSQKKRGGINTNEVLNVYKISGLDDTAIGNEYRVWKRGDVARAEVRFRGNARDQFADFTRTNVGKDMALLVDGKVSWTMVIGNEVSDGWLPVIGDWALKDAQAFCKRIDAARIRRQEADKTKP